MILVLFELFLYSTGLTGVSDHHIQFFWKIFRFLWVMVTFMMDSLNGLLKIYEFNVFCLKCYIFMPVCPQKMGPPNKKNLILYLNEGRISKAGHFSLWDGSHLFWKSGNVHNWPKKWLIFMNASKKFLLPYDPNFEIS